MHTAFKISMAASLAALAVIAHAQWDTRTSCYTWNGGNFSSGGFAQCDTNVAIVAEKPKPIPPAPAIAPSPVLMPMQTCAPPPKATHHIVKRKPKVQC